MASRGVASRGGAVASRRVASRRARGATPFRLTFNIPLTTHALMRYSQRGTAGHTRARLRGSGALCGRAPGWARVEPERLGTRATSGRGSVGGFWASRGAWQAEGSRAGGGRSSSGVVAAACSAVVDLVAGDSAPEQQARRAGEVARLVGDTRLPPPPLRRRPGALVGRRALDHLAERADEGAAPCGAARQAATTTTTTCRRASASSLRERSAATEPVRARGQAVRVRTTRARVGHQARAARGG